MDWGAYRDKLWSRVEPVIGEPEIASIPLKRTIIAWNDNSGDVMVGTDDGGQRWWTAYDKHVGGHMQNWWEASDADRIGVFLGYIMSIIVLSGVDPIALHIQLLKIREYHECVPHYVPGVLSPEELQA